MCGKMATDNFLKVLGLILVVILTNNIQEVNGCGPGRGNGGHRRLRKLTPLVFKQHEPNYEEYSAMASGVITGRITRNDTKFKTLLFNYNNGLIKFRDEEGTGADRVMTPRLSDRLNTLAISVANLWPGTKLHVIEAWDEDHVHGARSLHYEGRAVDIQTSDRDRTKNGMLARLAVEARFDWVYYEGKGHIHCSVKSEAYGSRTSGCFTGFSTVKTERGEIRKLNELQLGEKILSMDSVGNPIYSEVILFMDRDRTQAREFVKLTTDSNDTIFVTPSHLLYVWHSHLSLSRYIFADRVIIGDYLLVNIDNQLKPRQIVSIAYERHVGVYAPLTREGTVVVNSILASCYAVIDSQSIAHYSFTPIRLYKSIQNLFGGETTTMSKQNTTTKSIDSQYDMDSFNKYGQNGIHWYAKLLYVIKDYCLLNDWIYQT